MPIMSTREQGSGFVRSKRKLHAYGGGHAQCMLHGASGASKQSHPISPLLRKEEVVSPGRSPKIQICWIRAGVWMSPGVVARWLAKFWGQALIAQGLLNSSQEDAEREREQNIGGGIAWPRATPGQVRTSCMSILNQVPCMAS